MLYYRAQIVDFLLKKLKKGKKSARKTRIITKLTNWKNEIEFDNAALTLNDAFDIAPALDSSKTFKLTKINKVVKSFGNCEIKEGENVGGKNIVQNCWTYYAVVKSSKGKNVKKVFSYLFDIKKNGGKIKPRHKLYAKMILKKSYRMLFVVQRMLLTLWSILGE